jgi:hypothetical protein
MNDIYAKIKFQNIAAGMKSFPGIRAQQGSGIWAEDPARLAPALVM